MVRTLHSASVVVDVLEVGPEVAGGELEGVADELDVVPAVVDDVVASRVEVVEGREVLVDASTSDEVVREGATAAGLSPT